MCSITNLDLRLMSLLCKLLTLLVVIQSILVLMGKHWFISYCCCYYYCLHHCRAYHGHLSTLLSLSTYKLKSVGLHCIKVSIMYTTHCFLIPCPPTWQKMYNCYNPSKCKPFICILCSSILNVHNLYHLVSQ